MARNVVTKATNKNFADLNVSRSKDFMLELSKTTPSTFFTHFKMYLNEELPNEDIDEDFNYKWSQIETALYIAINKEQNVVRLASFFEKDYDQFHSQPLELLIDQVEKHVDSVLGKSTAVHKDTKNRTLHAVPGLYGQYTLMLSTEQVITFMYKLLYVYYR